MSNTQYSEVTKLTLKTQALLQRISELTSNYEEKYQDLRVDYTLEVHKRKELEDEISRLKEERESVRAPQETGATATDPADVPERDSDSD